MRGGAPPGEEARQIGSTEVEEQRFRVFIRPDGQQLHVEAAITILPRLASQWEAQKFLFVTNLPLPDYYSGSPPPIPGLTVDLGAAVLAAWAAAAVLAAFIVFIRRDVLA